METRRPLHNSFQTRVQRQNINAINKYRLIGPDYSKKLSPGFPHHFNDGGGGIQCGFLFSVGRQACLILFLTLLLSAGHWD